MPARMLNPLTESHYIVEIEGDPSRTKFTDCSGIAIVSETSEYSDGQARRIYKVVGMAKTENCKLSTPFDPEIHQPLLDLLDNMRNSKMRRSITITPVGDGNDPSPRGTGYTLVGAQLVKCEFADVNRGSAKVSLLKLEFAYDYYQQG